METILSILNKTAEFFGKKGVPNPKNDAQYVIAHGLGLKKMDLFLNFDRPLTEKELADLRPLVARRAKREPLQHILGSWSFRGHEVKCDKRALIPRPETEVMIDILISECGDAANKNDERLKILDIGTGSGVLAISAALELDANVVAVDISADALELAKENVSLHKLEEKITLIKSNLLSEVPKEKFIALLANLPYIPDSDAQTLQAEVINGDPHSALFGGSDGLEIIRLLLNSCVDFLKPNALVILEIASGQEKILRQEKFNNLEYVGSRNDYSGNVRFALWRAGADKGVFET